MPTLFDSENQNKTTQNLSLTDDQNGKILDQEPQVTKDMKKIDKHSLPNHNHNPLAAYCYFPDNVDFREKDSQEQVILLLRRHPITNVGWIAISFLMIIVPAFVSVIPPFTNLPGDFQFVIILIWYLVTSAFILEQFLNWFFHVNIVTDERVIDVDFVSLIYRQMTDANIDHIEDVTVEVGGGIRTLLGYGNVIIQTAAEVPLITFEAVPKPDLVAKVLRELRVQEEEERLRGEVR